MYTVKVTECEDKPVSIVLPKTIIIHINYVKICKSWHTHKDCETQILKNCTNYFFSTNETRTCTVHRDSADTIFSEFIFSVFTVDQKKVILISLSQQTLL